MTQATWRNRIVSYGEQPASQFIANPRNWRTHPQAQRDAMRGALNEVGFVQAVIVNRRTGYLVDGHERVWQALQNGDAPVPFVEVDLSEEEEAYVLATFDPLGAMAIADREQLDELLRDVQSGEAGVQAMLAELAEKEGVVPPMDAEDGDEPEPDMIVDVPDALWPTDNDWGIPVLDLALQAKAVELPVVKWGTQARTRQMRGTWHFYTDDYKFTALWKDPSPVVQSRCYAAIEPNLSTGVDMPRAVALWLTYQKRWIARLWQSYGVRMIVDLNVEPEFADLNMLGVPRGWKAYATRWLDAYGERDTPIQYEAAKAHAESDSILFVVIGGRAKAEAMCREYGWTWIKEHAGEVNDG